MPEWLEIIVRALILFSLFTLFIPLIGKKPISGMTILDHIVGLTIAVMTALIILKVVPSFAYGLLGLCTWFSVIVALQFIVQKSKWMRDHVYGKEVVVIKEGKVLEENLQSARLTPEELLAQLRRHDVFQVADVEFAVMENNGDISTLLKREKTPLTPQDLRIQTAPAQEPQTVILDGTIMDEPLTTLGLNRAWLFEQLNKIGVAPENVFIGQVDAMGELDVDLFDDSLQIPSPSAKPRLWIALGKIESDFMTYALETQNQHWQKEYERFVLEIQKIRKRLEPYLNS